MTARKPLVLDGAKVKGLPSGDTLQTNASATGGASLNLPHGTAPTAPVNGDVWTTSAGIFVQINGVTVGPLSTGGGGGGAAAWTLAASWTWSTNVANVDFTSLGSYDELIVIVRGVSASASGTRLVRVSTDNGATFYSTSGDYITMDNNGVETNSTGFPHSTATTAARSMVVHIRNTKGAVKSAILTAQSPVGLFVGSASDINAVRVTNTAGGNLTAGSAWIYGR